MELSGVPYRISHEEHPYSYALNIFDDIVDGAEDDDINDDNDTVKTKQRKQILQVKMYKKEQVFSSFQYPAKAKNTKLILLMFSSLVDKNRVFRHQVRHKEARTT